MDVGEITKIRDQFQEGQWPQFLERLEIAGLRGWQGQVVQFKFPVVAIVDSNCDPDDITYPIPGNDDAARAIVTYCDLVARAVIDGLGASQSSSGADLGAAVNAPVENLPPEPEAPAPAAV